MTKRQGQVLDSDPLAAPDTERRLAAQQGSEALALAIIDLFDRYASAKGISFQQAMNVQLCGGEAR